MSRPWMGYLAGAAFALTAAGAAAAYAQAAPPAPGERVREERTVIVRGDDGEQTTIVRRGDGGEERRMVMRRGEGRGEGTGDRRVMIMDHGGRDEAERLRTLLQLKPGQEAALTAYLAATHPDRDHERFVEMSDHHGPQTTPQRLAEMEKHMAEQAARGHARIEATRRFYEQLEPSQKKVFDELPMLMIGPMGPMMTMGPMKVMVNMARMPAMPPMPPMAPMPPHPPKAPPPPPPPPN
jgi:hypothetical protein